MADPTIRIPHRSFRSWTSAITILLFTLVWSSSRIAVCHATPNKSKESKKSLKSPVIDLTARNFVSHVPRGKVWLVEFYSPRCSHCVEFSSTYKEIAQHFNIDQPELNVRVAKVNGEAEQALLSRFGIVAYPSFFIIEGWSVYEFEAKRSKANLMQYVTSYKSMGRHIPYYNSPMGPIGMVQGTVIATGYAILDLLTFMQTRLGISAVFAAMLLFGSFFIGIFVTIVAMAIFIPSSSGARAKRD